GSPQRVFEELFSLVRNLWLTVRWPDVVDSLDVSEQERQFLQQEAPRWASDALRSLLASLAGLITQARQGVRPDVLTGLLLLALAPSQPRQGAAATLQAEPPRPKAAMPVPPPLPTPPAPREKKSEAGRGPERGLSPASEGQLPLLSGENLSQSSDESVLPALAWKPVPEEMVVQLLSRVQEVDFVLYCGLLDAALREAEGCLLLDMGCRYSYEVLRLARNCAGLARTLTGYEGGIFLRCGEETFACPAALPSPEPQAAEPLSERQVETAREERPRPSAFDLPPQPREGSGEAAQETPAFEAGLPFGGVVKEVSRVMRGELVLVRHEAGGATDEEENEDAASDEGSES
ncbi:MAG: hypothetical protein IJ702_00035, partial [Fretibacterium sp.]|nr:hypothetical protein [Fretibacterium sp.]